MSLCYFYKMVSKVNGAVYVGVTGNPVARFRLHASQAKTGTHQFQQFNGHLPADLQFEILAQRDCPGGAVGIESQLYESKLIRKHGAVNRGGGGVLSEVHLVGISRAKLLRLGTTPVSMEQRRARRAAMVADMKQGMSIDDAARKYEVTPTHAAAIARQGTNPRIRTRTIDEWANADWSRTDAELAKEHKVSRQRVSQVRAALGRSMAQLRIAQTA